MKRSIFVILAASLTLFIGCSDSGNTDPEPDVGADAGPSEVQLSYNFNDGMNGWETDVTDYPTGAREGLSFVGQVRPLPADVSETDKALYMEAQNTPADVFMFARKQLGPDDGLEPNTGYRVSYELTFSTNYPDNCTEQAGQLMFLKMGGSTWKPANVQSSDQSRYEFNMEKGNGEVGGDAASTAGDLTHDEDCAIIYDRYTTVTRSHDHSAVIQTDDEGKLWLIVGVDSGYQGQTSFYFNTLDVTLTPAAE